MSDKKYKCGLYVGRFQPIHLGHYNIIDIMLRNCETVIIAVGSAQECGTIRNPFSYGLRAAMIAKSFSFAHDQVMVIPVPDREHPSNDPSWGDYLLNTVKMYTGMTPDVIYEGVETERDNWYDNHDIHVERISRQCVRVSSTEVRQAMLEGKFTEVDERTPRAVYMNYHKLREELLKCYNSQQT